MSNTMNIESLKLHQLLSSKIDEIMKLDPSAPPVFKDGVLQSHLLQKTRSSEPKTDYDRPTFSISDYEIERAALTIAHAISNPYRYADMVKCSPVQTKGSKQHAKLQKYFGRTKIGKIGEPATIVDCHGKILVWFLPDILSPCHITFSLEQFLVDRMLTENHPGVHMASVYQREGEYLWQDVVTVSPGYFMQRRERLVDPLVTSVSYSSDSVQNWLVDMSNSEYFWNAITATIAPKLYQAGGDSISKVSRLEVISNHMTLSHRDPGGAPSHYDMLHSVRHWNKGEHYVIAHFMKDKGVKRAKKRLRHTVVGEDNLEGTGETSASCSPQKRTKFDLQELGGIPEGLDRELEGDFTQFVRWQTKVETKTQNNFIEDYLMFRQLYLDIILESEHIINEGTYKSCQSTEGFFRCLTCSVLQGHIAVRAWVYLAYGSWSGVIALDPQSINSIYICSKHNCFPTSTSRPWTAFTFDVLDHFLIDALECKTSAMSFFQKLHRLTNNAFPGSVPDQYSCPQPGINMPVNWQDHYESWLVMQRYVVDGNFTAQHMNMKQPHLDVTLSDGLGYMVTDIDYQAHLSSAKETKEWSSCSNHRAVNAANLFLTLWWIFRRVNGCQWCIHFKDRINNSPELSLPEKCQILTGVGKFHLSAHKLPCFARFSFNFIEGAGQVDGEIMETLWAPFNKISPTAQMLLKKHKRAVQGINDTKLPFDELTHTLDPVKIAIWEKDEKMAMELQGEHLDIYQLKINKERPGSIPWIIQDVRRLPYDATATQKAALQEKQLKLAFRITKFHEIADQMMEGIELDWGTVHVDDPQFCMAEADEQAWEVSDEDNSELIDEEIPAEDMVIWMPSSMTHEHANVLGLAKLQEEELALRKGQANNCLEKL
ncbi:hypothetical protein EDD22DRAFT_846611 [Suillus occidentalis]|nr:hypothetical protein EDD22DRAFT_846611 [Suillus occidentalis]